VISASIALPSTFATPPSADVSTLL